MLGLAAGQEEAQLRRIGVSAIVIALVAAIGLVPGLQIARTTAIESPNEQDLAYAIGFRADMGFEHDKAFVASTFANQEMFHDEEWGLPLSLTEALDLMQRSTLRASEQEAVDYAYAQPDFGGMWFDQQRFVGRYGFRIYRRL